MPPDPPPKPALPLEADALVRVLFDDVPFCLGIGERDEVDDDIVFVLSNASHARFIGFPREEIPGLRVSRFAPPAVRKVWHDAYAQAKATGEQVQFELFMPHGHPPGFYSVSVSYLGSDTQGRGRFGFVFMNITARKELEAELSRKNEALSRKQAEVLALSTPLLQVWEGVLALPVIGDLDAERAAHIMERLLHAIARRRTRVAILDLTGVDEVDTESAGHLLRIARAVGLLGSRCLLSGISPRIAQTMTSIGIATEGLATFGTLQDALKHALERTPTP